MDLSSESPVMRRLQNRPGVALAAAIFGIIVISFITAGVWTMNDLDTRATRNREDAALALRLAQRGQTHAMSLLRTQLEGVSFNTLLRGQDNNKLLVDDNGLLINYPALTSDLAIPKDGKVVAGVGRYYVTIIDDPGETDNDPFTDTNQRILMRCTGETNSGSRAVVDVIVRLLPQLPAMLFGANASFGSELTVDGACGNVHVNGQSTFSGGAKTVNSTWTSSSGPWGQTVNKAGGGTTSNSQLDAMEIPPMSSSQYCGDADFVLNGNGSVVDRRGSTPVTYTSGNSWITNTLGWQLSSGTWKTNKDAILSGTYCVMGTSSTNPNTSGNVVIGNAIGKTTTNGFALTILATGSVQISAEAKLTSKHPSGVVVLSDWELDISGQATLWGTVYANNFCKLSGQVTITGQLLCRSVQGTPPAGANDSWVTQNVISGTTKVTYGCGATQSTDKYKISAWYQRLSL